MKPEIRILCTEAELVPIEKLSPYELNAKEHPKAQIEQLAGIMKRIGWTKPILVTGDNRIIAGHGATQAAKSLGMKAIPVTRIDDISVEEYKALVISDNQIASNGGWHLDLLAEELQELASFDFDVDLLGFSEEDTRKLLEFSEEELSKIHAEAYFKEENQFENLKLEEEKQEEAGEEEEPQENPEVGNQDDEEEKNQFFAEPGEKYKLGSHVLICGEEKVEEFNLMVKRWQLRNDEKAVRIG